MLNKSSPLGFTLQWSLNTVMPSQKWGFHLKSAFLEKLDYLEIGSLFLKSAIGATVRFGGRDPPPAVASQRLSVSAHRPHPPGRLLGWVGECCSFLRLLMFWSRRRSRGENHIYSGRERTKRGLNCKELCTYREEFIMSIIMILFLWSGGPKGITPPQGRKRQQDL